MVMGGQWITRIAICHLGWKLIRLRTFFVTPLPLIITLLSLVWWWFGPNSWLLTQTELRHLCGKTLFLRVVYKCKMTPDWVSVSDNEPLLSPWYKHPPAWILLHLVNSVICQHSMVCAQPWRCLHLLSIFIGSMFTKFWNPSLGVQSIVAASMMVSSNIDFSTFHKNNLSAWQFMYVNNNDSNLVWWNVTSRPDLCSK